LNLLLLDTDQRVARLVELLDLHVAEAKRTDLLAQVSDIEHPRLPILRLGLDLEQGPALEIDAEIEPVDSEYRD